MKEIIIQLVVFFGTLSFFILVQKYSDNRRDKRDPKKLPPLDDEVTIRENFYDT